MTVVVGTAGHIDHGKTALLRALTGIDADRLPEERRRGMTIDVGYAHLGLPDGTELDFVDVPGHDRLVGNMLVGAGEIDAAMLVVAADDGPRAQTLEHLELLDALGLRHGIAAVTKVDLVDAARVSAVQRDVAHLLEGTALAGAPVFAVSSETGRGIDGLLTALVELRDRIVAAGIGEGSNRTRLAIDRIFNVKGRGTVVTGTLRGGAVRRNATLRLVPGGANLRARELQVHGRAVDEAGPGRTAINVAGIEMGALHRGMVLTDDPGVVATDRLLVRLGRSVPDRTRVRVHLGTAAVDGAVGRSGRDAIDLPDGDVAAILRLAAPVAAAQGDRFVIRGAAGDERTVGGTVLDPSPPRGISRRRQTEARLRRLAEATAETTAGTTGPQGGTSAAATSASAGTGAAPAATSSAPAGTSAVAARLDLHGAVRLPDGRMWLADDVADTGIREILTAVFEGQSGPESGVGLAAVRVRAARALRRVATLRRDEAGAAASDLVDRLVADGRVTRQGERLWPAGRERRVPAAPDPDLAAAMDRLERAIAVSAPQPLSEAARAVGCPPNGIRELERSGRIAVIDDDLAYAAATYRDLERQALELASRDPLTPAALRDATGTSRKFVMAILADLDRRGILRRTEAGHVPGPRAPSMGVPTGGPPDRR
jgi:selenocysteine-specific elongation factor